MQQGENHNHKPVFSNCSNYAPIVQEEELAGTVVIQVLAEDRDRPEEGGEPRDRVKLTICLGLYEFTVVAAKGFHDYCGNYSDHTFENH